MGEVLITRRGGSGGGLKNTDAVLIVSALTGSTITATKNSTTITPTIWAQSADNTKDTAIFTVPASTFDSTAWTVSASLSGDTVSDTVVIDSAKEYEIIFNYDRVLFYNGTVDSELGSIIAVANTTIGTTINTTEDTWSGNYWCSDNMIAITRDYTTLNFEVSVTTYNNQDNFKPRFGLANSKITQGSLGTQQAKLVSYYTSGITSGYAQLSVDISSNVGNSYYIAMVAIATTATRKIWLSK